MNDQSICKKCGGHFQGFGATICSRCLPPEEISLGNLVKVERGDNFTKSKKRK